MGRVAGKVALVTGAANGIGRACALALGREGASVVVTDVQVAAGEAVVGELTRAGGTARFLPLDTSDEAAWVSVVAEVAEALGALHVLVNNAGVFVRASVTDMTLEAWRRVQAVNVDGVFLGVKHTLPLIRASGGGSILNMSSVAGIRGSADFSAYCASKGAVRTFTKAVAMECAAARDGVRVNSIHPGLIDTGLWDDIGGFGGGGHGPDLDAIAARAVPLRDKGTPQDVAEAVIYLVSAEARYVTGIEFVIDGGLVAG